MMQLPWSGERGWAGLAREDLDATLESTEDVWRSLRGSRFFLTGATGFFGVWLLATMAHAVTELGLRIPVTILTRDAKSSRARYGAVFDALGAELVEGDTRSFAFPDGTFSHVLHGATAASASLNASAPFEMFDVIVGGTRRVLELATAARASRFFLMSSGAVYGPQPPSMTHIPETYGGGPSPLDVGNAYAEGKRAAELLSAIQAKSAGFELVVARAFAFVGPYLPLDAHFAIGNFLRDAMAEKPIQILGDGTPYRSYMYAADLAVWLWTLLVRGRPNTAYNVGSDDGRPLREIADRVAALTGGSVHVARPPTGQPPARYVPDVTLATTELGLGLRFPLDAANQRTLAWSRAGG